ncbi:transglutaminase family protein [Opitutales bacterium]|nr:transglutaminase family protein [Opitutales bacterium]
MRLYIFHRTSYRYPGPVTQSYNELRLHPLTNDWQKCISSTVSILPICRPQSYLDLNGNIVQFFELAEEHQKLAIEVRSDVETRLQVNFEEFPYGVNLSTLAKMEKVPEYRDYLQTSTFVEINPEIWRTAVDIQANSNDVFQTAYQVMGFIYQNFEYSKSTTTVETHANEVLKIRRGVCQDFVHVALALCRCLGIPARYVSGYFFDSTRERQMRGAEASHAWLEVMVEGHGWFGLDPTNNRVVDDTYVILGTGRDYRDVAPVTGSYFGPKPSEFEVVVRVKQTDD